MSQIRKSKDEIIKDIMDLRTMISRLHSFTLGGYDNQYDVDETQRQLNRIQDKIFNL